MLKHRKEHESNILKLHNPKILGPGIDREDGSGIQGRNALIGQKLAERGLKLKWLSEAGAVRIIAYYT